jgi:hypothetical protein
MFKKDNRAVDKYTLSLGGMTAISSFAAAPAIAHDRLRQVRDAGASNARRQKCRSWLPERFRIA